LGGKLSIKSSARTNPVVSYRKILKAGSRTDAEEFADFIYLNIEELEGELSISAETKSYPPWAGTNYSGRIDVEIELPKNDQLKIYARTTVYDIDVVGPFATLDVNNVVGTVNVRGIASKVKVTSDNSEVRISECSGPVTVKTSMRPLSLVDVDSRLGTIKLRNVNGDISLRKVKGEIDARTELAPITGDELNFSTGRSIIRTENSTVELKAISISGDVAVYNSNGKTDLVVPGNSSAVYNLKIGEGGRIYTKALLFKADAVGRTLLRGSTGSGKNRIDIDMRGVGTINLAGE
jgi:hypothetical protein